MTVEPWLRGPIPGVDPLLAPILRSFEMAIEDVTGATEDFTAAEIWLRPYGLAPVGFHIRHIGGSVDRLMTYALGGQLGEPQLAALKTELEPGAPRGELLAAVRAALDAASARVRAIDAATLRDPRGVGRKALPTTLGGLLIHIAEHTQRHTGQAVTTAKLVRALRGESTSR